MRGFLADGCCHVAREFHALDHPRDGADHRVLPVRQAQVEREHDGRLGALRLAGTTDGVDGPSAEQPEMDEMEISMIALVYLVMIGASLVLGYFTFHRWNFNWFPEAGAPIAVRSARGQQGLA